MCVHDDGQAVEGKSRRRCAPSALSQRLSDEGRSDDPRSYYSVSSRLVRETPNAWKANQYDNLSNRQAHYEQTGRRSGGKPPRSITHLVRASARRHDLRSARYLREKKPAIKPWASTRTDRFQEVQRDRHFDKNEIYPYSTEASGDFLPKKVEFDLIDHFEKVTDKDAAIMTGASTREKASSPATRRGPRWRGLLQLRDRSRRMTWSSCSPRPRHALSRQDVQRRLDARKRLPREDRTRRGRSGPSKRRVPLVTLRATDSVARAVKVMTDNASRSSVTRRRRVVGAINETQLYAASSSIPVSTRSRSKRSCSRRFRSLTSDRRRIAGEDDHAGEPAVLVRDFKTENTYIITRSDVIKCVLLALPALGSSARVSRGRGRP